MDIHPVCNLFPEMGREEFQAFADDIAKNGQREPIWTYQGQIIDGRHRYRACLAFGRQPITREWDGSGSLTAFVLSLNLHRRHLCPGDLAKVGVAAEEFFAEEGRQRMAAAGRKSAPGRPEKGMANLPDLIDDAVDVLTVETESEPWTAREQAAKAVGVSPRLIQDAKYVKEHSPELYEQIGPSLTVHAAKKAITGTTTTRTTRVEVAEPTAVYLNSQPDNFMRWIDAEVKAGRLSIFNVVSYRDSLNDYLSRVSEVA